ncbi:MAG: hypothetical protein Q9218_000542 [Villophora microphyllina]
MMIDQDPNQKIHKKFNQQQDNSAFRGGRGRGGPGPGPGPGPSSDRGRGFQIRGRGRGDFKHGGDNIEHNKHNSHDLVKIVVNGLLESSAASERDNGMTACRKFLVEMANEGYNQPREYVYLKSLRWEGDELVFGVKKAEVGRILKSDGQLFRGVQLSVRRAHSQNKDDRASDTAETETAENLQMLNAVLDSRYNKETKVLSLERLSEDLRLGTLGASVSNANPFQRLMRLCESERTFPSRAAKAEWIESISLANNDLVDVSHIIELAKVFPDIRNLDLSHNNFRELKTLEMFRGKFKRLDLLILSPNPIESWNPNYSQTIVDWFPTLSKLNKTQVRTDDAAAAAVAAAASLDDTLLIATFKDNFQDQDRIAETAIKQLIIGMDSDRANLARTLYDDDSTFSLSYNPSPPLLLTAQSASWEPHRNQNRNLKEVSELGPRIKRVAKGIEAIEQALNMLPPTRHPDLISEAEKYSFDCTPIPGVPDPKGRSPSGVLGFKVDIRGSFNEIDSKTSNIVTRSFDRVLVLGPGRAEGSVRIVSDILTLRAEGGYEALQTKAKTTSDKLVGMTSTGLSIPVAVNLEEVKRAAMAEQISKATGLTKEWTNQLLVDSGWNFKLALEKYKIAKVYHSVV